MSNILSDSFFSFRKIISNFFSENFNISKDNIISVDLAQVLYSI
jgi:hypothetical protein